MLQNTWDNLGVGIIVVITTRDNHYFEEPDIEDCGKVYCNMVVAKPKLTDEDKAELKEQAMMQYKQEQLRELRRQSQLKAQPKAQPKPTTTASKAGAEIDTAPNLFDNF